MKPNWSVLVALVLTVVVAFTSYVGLFAALSRLDEMDFIVAALVATALFAGWVGWRVSGEYTAHPEIERLMHNLAARRQERADPGPTMAEIPVRIQRLIETPEERECHRRG